MVAELRGAVISFLCFFIASCSLNLNSSDDTATPSDQYINGKSGYFAKRNFSYLDIPYIQADIELPPFYYDDNDFYQFYELSSFDIIVFFKENKVIPPKVKFSVISIGKTVLYNGGMFTCSIIDEVLSNSANNKEFRKKSMVYIVTIGNGKILDAKKITKPLGVGGVDAISVCYESLY